jgi:hypothetical protein
MVRSGSVNDSGFSGSGELERDDRLQEIKNRWNQRVPLSAHAPGWPTWPHEPTPDQLFEQARADINWLIAQLQADPSLEGARDALAVLTPYVRHDANCASRLKETDCNCGASAALQAMHAALRGPPAERALPEQDWLADFWQYWRTDPAGEWFSDFLEYAKVAFESRAAGRKPGSVPPP